MSPESGGRSPEQKLAEYEAQGWKRLKDLALELNHPLNAFRDEIGKRLNSGQPGVYDVVAGMELVDVDTAALLREKFSSSAGAESAPQPKAEKEKPKPKSNKPKPSRLSPAMPQMVFPRGYEQRPARIGVSNKTNEKREAELLAAGYQNIKDLVKEIGIQSDLGREPVSIALILLEKSHYPPGSQDRRTVGDKIFLSPEAAGWLRNVYQNPT